MWLHAHPSITCHWRSRCEAWGLAMAGVMSVQIFTGCLFLPLEIRDFIPQNNENCLILKSLNVSC